MFNRKTNKKSESYPRDTEESRSDSEIDKKTSNNSDSDSYQFEAENNLLGEISKLIPRNFYSLIIEALIEDKFDIVEFLINRGITLPMDKNSFYPLVRGVKNVGKIYEKYLEIHTSDKMKRKNKNSTYPILNIKFHLGDQKTDDYIKNLIYSDIEKNLKIRLLKDLVNESEKDNDLSDLFFNSYIKTKIGDYLLMSVKLGKKLSSFFDSLHDSFSPGFILILSLESDEDVYLKNKVLKNIFLTNLEIDLFIQMKNFSFSEIALFNKIREENEPR